LLKLLDTLENIVTSQIISNQTNPSVETFEECLSVARSEQEKIKKNLLGLVITISNEQNTCLFIKHFQSKLINLSNLLYSHIETAPELLSFPQAKAEVSEFTKISMLQLIDDLLTHSLFHFSQFSDNSFLIPNHIRDIAIKQFQCLIDDLIDLKKCLPEKFIEIINEPIHRFVNNPLVGTFANLNYLKRFTTEISNIISNTEEENLFNAIKTKLIYLNFNSLAYFDFLTNEIKADIEKLNTIHDRIVKLSLCFKELNQTPIKPGLAYNSQQKTIYEFVNQWIVEEMCFLEKTSQVVSIRPNGIDTSFKIVTDLSVPQLAYFLKILVDTGILKSNNDSDLIKFIASFTRSKKTDRISPESLRTKYYTVEENTKDELKKVVIKLLNHINNSLSIMILLVFQLNYILEGFGTIPLTFCG
jgi:hypothetical protein